MEKRIQNMDAETRTAHYLKYFCEHKKYKYQCRECKGSQICRITDKNLDAESAAGPNYAPITGKKITVRSAVTRLK